MTAAADGAFNEARRLLEREKADVNCQDTWGFTPLHCACLNGSIQLIRYLLHSGATVNVKDSVEWTPLHFAVMSNHVEATSLLLEHGADPMLTNHQGTTALDLAVSLKIKYLLLRWILQHKHRAAKAAAQQVRRLGNNRGPVVAPLNREQTELVALIRHQHAETNALLKRIEHVQLKQETQQATLQDVSQKLVQAESTMIMLRDEFNVLLQSHEAKYVPSSETSKDENSAVLANELLPRKPQDHKRKLEDIH